MHFVSDSNVIPISCAFLLISFFFRLFLQHDSLCRTPGKRHLVVHPNELAAPSASELAAGASLFVGELQTSQIIKAHALQHPSSPPHTQHATRHTLGHPKTCDDMASRFLRPALRTARGFQTSAALRQEAPLVAPVRRPVGAFRGG